MMERNINIEVKDCHVNMIKCSFKKCQDEFKQIMEKETGRIMETNLTVSEYGLEEANQKIIGGIFLRSSDGVIVCDNSIDSRVRLIF